ncbi:MAG: hypothetical protein ABIG10_02395 [bacterium]
MKRFFFLLLLMPMLAISCGTTEILTKNDEGNIIISKEYLETTYGYKSDKPIFSAKESNDDIVELDVYEDYVRTSQDPLFQIGQIEVDDDDNIIKVPWSVDIVEIQGQLFFKPSDKNFFMAEERSGRAIPGPAYEGYKPVRYSVGFYLSKDSSHVKNKYNLPYIGKLSWQIDLRDQVVEIWQWRTKFPFNDVPFITPVELGKDYAIIDRRHGDWLQLKVNYEGDNKYFDVVEEDNKRGDVIDLENLKIIPYRNGKREDGDPNFLFQILDKPKPKIIKHKQIKPIMGYPAKDDIRYVDWKNYNNGFIRINCQKLHCNHPEIYKELEDIGAIGKGQENVIVSPAWLQSRSFALFDIFRDYIEYHP